MRLPSQIQVHLEETLMQFLSIQTIRSMQIVGTTILWQYGETVVQLQQEQLIVDCIHRGASLSPRMAIFILTMATQMVELTSGHQMPQVV